MDIVGFHTFTKGIAVVTRITIERLGHQGDGIADGPIFVPRTLPGEIVSGLVENGRIVGAKIEKPSSERIRPACKHYKNCGGCALQHVQDAFVESWKKQVVIQALEAQGLPAPLRQMHTSPPQSRRRATLTMRRLKKGTQVGFNGAQSEAISEIDACLLLRPEIIQMLPFLRDVTLVGGSRRGRMSATLTVMDNGVDIIIRGGKPLTPELYAQLVHKTGAAANLVRLTWDAEQILANATPELGLGNTKINPPAGAFLQATRAGEHALLASVMSAVGSASHIADLFAGCGTFALPLAQTASVHAVENAPEMLDALQGGWRRAEGLKAVSIEARDLAKNPMRPEELAKFEAVVLDPPRAGAEAQVNEIAKADVPNIVMVSCNPVSFARDVKILVEAGYDMQWVDIVDQFRWSPHIELVASLVRK